MDADEEVRLHFLAQPQDERLGAACSTAAFGPFASSGGAAGSSGSAFGPAGGQQTCAVSTEVGVHALHTRGPVIFRKRSGKLFVVRPTDPRELGPVTTLQFAPKDAEDHASLLPKPVNCKLFVDVERQRPQLLALMQLADASNCMCEGFEPLRSAAPRGRAAADLILRCRSMPEAGGSLPARFMQYFCLDRDRSFFIVLHGEKSARLRLFRRFAEWFKRKLEPDGVGSAAARARAREGGGGAAESVPDPAQEVPLDGSFDLSEGALPQPALPQPALPEGALPQPALPQPPLPEGAPPQPAPPQPDLPQPALPGGGDVMGDDAGDDACDHADDDAAMGEAASPRPTAPRELREVLAAHAKVLGLQDSIAQLDEELQTARRDVQGRNEELRTARRDIQDERDRLAQRNEELRRDAQRLTGERDDFRRLLEQERRAGQEQRREQQEREAAGRGAAARGCQQCVQLGRQLAACRAEVRRLRGLLQPQAGQPQVGQQQAGQQQAGQQQRVPATGVPGQQG